MLTLLKLIHQDISSAYLFLIVDLRERGTRFVLTWIMRHYFSGQIILEIILTIQNMEMYYRKSGSLANDNVNCIDFYWYKFNKLWKDYEMLKNILYFLCLTFFDLFFCCRRVPLSLKSTIKKNYAEEISRWITFRKTKLQFVSPFTGSSDFLNMIMIRFMNHECDFLSVSLDLWLKLDLG